MQRLISTRWLSVCFAAFLALLMCQTAAQSYVIVFKDGFVIRGKIRKERTYIVDRVSGKAFSVPLSGAPYEIDTATSYILFSPQQVFDVVEEEPTAIPQWMDLRLFGRRNGYPMPLFWGYYKVGDWNARWEREIWLLTAKGQLKAKQQVRQRITNLNPIYVRVRALNRYWAAFYDIKEFEPQIVRGLLMAEFNKKKAQDKTKFKHENLSEVEKHIKIAHFLTQCGWIDHAEKELQYALKAMPGEKSRIESELAVLSRVKALQFVADLKVAYDMGRYQEVQQRLAEYDKENMSELVPPDIDLQVFEIKDQWETLKAKVKTAEQLLKTFPNELPAEFRSFFKPAAADILQELSFDTVDRLDTFVDMAEAHLLDVQQKRQPYLKPEQVMSFAVTGWLLGEQAAEENVETAEKLWKTRDFVLKYQNTHFDVRRRQLRETYENNVNLGKDLLARVIKMLPPPEPHGDLTTKVQKLQTNLPQGGVKADYYIQLPPEYQHLRSYPVLIALHEGGEDAKAQIEHWSKLAARHGYILVAPIWAHGFQTSYSYGEREQELMMNLLRDLRRRFQIDSNRVFLFGIGEGGQMAYDVGLAHPDQFAGVLPMSASPQQYAEVYWPNAQHLPFYVVDGELNGLSPKDNEKQFKTWIRYHYPVLYVEYKGRGKEWFGGELPRMIDWMNRKERHFPLHQVGKRSRRGGRGQEFSTLRTTDNHFYWLSSNNIFQRANPGPQLNSNVIPAYLQAQIFSGNQIYVTGKGIRQCSIWLAPGMIDFTKKVEVRFNGTKMGRPRTITPSLEVLMEDFYTQGDRDRLFLARIDLP